MRPVSTSAAPATRPNTPTTRAAREWATTITRAPAAVTKTAMTIPDHRITRDRVVATTTTRAPAAVTKTATTIPDHRITRDRVVATTTTRAPARVVATT